MTFIMVKNVYVGHHLKNICWEVRHGLKMYVNVKVHLKDCSDFLLISGSDSFFLVNQSTFKLSKRKDPYIDFSKGRDRLLDF